MHKLGKDSDMWECYGITFYAFSCTSRTHGRQTLIIKYHKHLRNEQKNKREKNPSLLRLSLEAFGSTNILHVYLFLVFPTKILHTSFLNNPRLFFVELFWVVFFFFRAHITHFYESNLKVLIGYNLGWHVLEYLF